VLRNGEPVGTIGIGQATPLKIVQMMFGEVLQKRRPPELVVREESVLELQKFTRAGAFENVSFTLFRGEVLGIAGLLGSGRTELLRALFGADRHDSGSVILRGHRVSPTSPEQMKRLGMALAPENRKEEGLVQILSTRMNICLASLQRIATHGFTTADRERKLAARNARDIDITVSSLDAAVSSLSGGNQQKVVLAKWLNTEPAVILLDEPTRGIDIQAKQQIFQIIWDLSSKGISSIVVSSELEELMEACHRILVMKQGTIVKELLPQQSTLEELFATCME
jgi:ribose transport system ATP-binding protein